ncbi:MAG: CocE/NonD family hydrolase [Verrucomicrobiales bacterium]|nr:CocE/NonD family hydrolase [Verrucomicrobiales bacterium]
MHTPTASRPAQTALMLIAAVTLGGVRGAAAVGTMDRAGVETAYTKHEFRVPMRDGVRLHTRVLLPKDDTHQYPILLRRTPYGLRPYGSSAFSEPVGSVQRFLEDRFILVEQDVRGRMASEGKFVHVRPFQPVKTGPEDIDESTDAWDTIDWLVRHLPGHNGRVGMFGISYPGFYTSMGMIDSHPALRAASPQAPVADWFRGDDFRHNGALFLAHAFNFLAQFEWPLEHPTRERPRAFDHQTPDGYAFFLDLGSLANAETLHFKGRVPFWSEVVAHPNYDDFWKARNILPHLRNIRCAVLTVGGWYDAEDLYGTLATYQAVERQNPGLTNLLVMGPWAHGDWGRGEGDRLGHVSFRARTADFYREQIELPFFRHFLKGETNWALPEAFVFETGTHQWRRFDQWPPRQSTEATLFLQAAGRLAGERPGEGESAFDEYVSDPAKPVPYIPNIASGMTREYMTDDQRFAASRPDVLVYATAPLEEDLTIVGPIAVTLHVSTSGTDADWVVKLIDVYEPTYPDPEPNPAGVRMGGYQQLVRGEPMRGRFRQSFERPEPFVPGQVERVSWEMPDVFHTFRRGHRVMVHVQSTWFPLVDRNPQTFVDAWRARPEHFQRALQRVYRGGLSASAITFGVLREAGLKPGS